MKIRELYKNFLNNNDIYWVPIISKNHSIFIEYSNLNNRIIPESDLKIVDELININSKEGIWFFCYLINVIESLPASYMAKTLYWIMGFTQPYMITRSYLKNLVRIFSFQKILKKILEMYDEHNLSITKLHILFLLNELRIDHSLDYVDGVIQVPSICWYHWEDGQFKRNYTISREGNFLDLAEELNSLMFKRYQLMMNDYLNKEWPIEIKQLLYSLTPPTKEMCPPELLDDYNKLHS